MAVLVSISVTPDPASVPEGGQIQLTATGHFDDASTQDLTSFVQWFVDPGTTAVSVASGSAQGGRCFGLVSGGSAWVYCWYGTDLGVLDAATRTHSRLENTVTVPVRPAAARREVVAPAHVPPPVEITEGSVSVTVTARPPTPEPEPDPDDPDGSAGRFFLALDGPTLEPFPVWYQIDSWPNLITSYTIDRGRSFELDRTDVGRATVTVTDPDGILDPTNPTNTYWPKLQPLLQACIGRRNPVTGEYKLRFRGFVDSFDYTADPNQKVGRLTISLVDQMELLSAAEMQPGQFGYSPPADSADMVFYPAHVTAGQRMVDVLSHYGIAQQFRVILNGAVTVLASIYSPGETVLSALQEAADAEFPGVSNLYCDRRGRLVFYGRLARFYPADVAAAVGPDNWDYHAWDCGDGAYIDESGPEGIAQVREFSYSRSLSKIINWATAYPAVSGDGAEDAIKHQLVWGPASLNKFGIRSWSAPSLLTLSSTIDDADALTETKRFATYYVENYQDPANRVTSIAFRSMRPDDPRAAANWELLNGIDISDSISIRLGLPGGGGFVHEQYFVEGIHEQVSPLQPGYDDVTVRLDLSPRAHYTTNPWPLAAGLNAGAGFDARTL